MKKSILNLLFIIGMMVTAASGFAQKATPDTAKAKTPPKPKPEYKVDPEKTYVIPALTSNEIQVLIKGEDDWKAMHQSEESIYKFEQYKDFANDVHKKLLKWLNDQLKADYKKFCADTAAANKPLPGKLGRNKPLTTN